MQQARLVMASLLVAAVSFVASPSPAAPATARSAARTGTEERPVAGKEGERIDQAIRAYFTGSAGAAYGGSYLDDQGRTVLLVTRDIERIRRDFHARLDGTTQLVIRPARYALSDLDRIVDDLSARLDALRATGAPVMVVALDEEANRVWVGLRTDSSAARDVVLATLDPSDRAAIAFGTSGTNVLQ